MKNTQNKKIRNATVCKGNSITFKSRLEKQCYNDLVEAGYKPEYEYRQITLIPGFSPVTPFYSRETDSQYEKRCESKGGKSLRLEMNRQISIKYTPDLYMRVNGYDVWIELKGICNDVYPIKRKLFRKYLDELQETTGQKSLFFEIYSRKHLQQALRIIREYSENNTEYDNGKQSKTPQ